VSRVSSEIGWDQVAGSLALVALAVGLARWQRVPLGHEIAWAVLRSFVQLIALGFVIKLIFEAGNVGYVVPLLAAMVVFGAFTARGRAPRVPNGFAVLVLALGVSATATLGLALATGALSADARTLIPVGGMVIGNAMTSAAVALARLQDEVLAGAGQIEARLSLGATARQSIQPVLRRSLTAGMINVVDSTKTAGLVFIPGTTVGMLLGGAEPLDAIRLQLILFYLLVGGVAIAVVLAGSLACRGFFTPAHQLRDLEPA
jgi:putative ABC transport system permease protein